MFDLGIINGLVYIDGKFIKTNVYINQNKISNISTDIFPCKDTVNVSKALVMPALIDPHVHFNLDLGWIHSRDDFFAGSIQAAYGGITTIVDFLEPVDNPVDLEKAYYKRLEEASQSVVDYYFHATIKNPKCNLEEFVLKMKELKINSLKLFTTYSDSDRRTYDEDIIELLKLSDKYNFLLLAHIENDDLIDLNPELSYKELSHSRPTLSETKEAMKLASFVREYGGYLYMVHCSSGYTLQKLATEYKDIINKRFFIESCPHYFTFTDDYVQNDDGYLYTLAPPLRSLEELRLLKENFDSIYSIGTDHCAFNVADKTNYYLNKIPLGIGSIEYSFDVMYNLFKEKAIDKMSKNIFNLYGLKDRGEIKIGNLANLFVYELMDNTIDEIHGLTDYSIYKNLPRLGRVVHTINRGEFVIRNLGFVKPNGLKI